MAIDEIKRGDIFYADLSLVIGSEQGGVRPVLIVQNNIGNHYSPTVIVAAITARISKPKMPTHVGIKAHHTGIEKDSVILLEQIRTIDKQRLKDHVAHLDDATMIQVDHALEVSIGLGSKKTDYKKRKRA
jgi:mRNA interferase MazF